MSIIMRRNITMNTTTSMNTGTMNIIIMRAASIIS